MTNQPLSETFVVFVLTQPGGIFCETCQARNLNPDDFATEIHFAVVDYMNDFRP